MRVGWRAAPVCAVLLPLIACGGGGAEAVTSRLGGDKVTAEGKRPGPRWPAAVVELRGPEEVPGPGHPTARGWAEVTLVAPRHEVCVEIRVEGLDRPTAAHLHQSGRGQAGDVVLALPSPSSGDGTVNACVSAAASVIDQLAASPEEFYLNVHTAEHPDGALRGQLR